MFPIESPYRNQRFRLLVAIFTPPCKIKGLQSHGGWSRFVEVPAMHRSSNGETYVFGTSIVVGKFLVWKLDFNSPSLANPGRRYRNIALFGTWNAGGEELDGFRIFLCSCSGSTGRGDGFEGNCTWDNGSNHGGNVGVDGNAACANTA